MLVLIPMILILGSCNSVDNSDSQQALKPSIPEGVQHEFIVELPKVSEPLPAVDYISRNDGNGRFYRDTNPVDYALKGINNIWQGTTETWQTTAGDYSRDVDGYKAGDGPGPDDYLPAGTEIKDAETWKANIQYVVKVTSTRTKKQEYYAFLDDIRCKNYSVIDGFGPLTEDYAKNSGAYASFNPILITDVTENKRYKPDNNDSFTEYGGKKDSTLGKMVSLASLFRDYYASTSGPKYVFATPRPWRMNDDGGIEFLGVETFSDVVDGSSADRELIEKRIDSYNSNVKLIPGLYCARRAHSSSKEKKGLYSADTENRRKDNGYPSGHTNAGVLSSLAYAYMLPERFAENVMRGSDLGENRIIAGMHSPVDVIGGRIQALMVAAAALNHNQDTAEAAYEQAFSYFGQKAEAEGMNLYDYAHRNVTEGSFVKADGTMNVDVFNNNWFSNHEALKETYKFRLTYGLPQNGTKGLEPIVPKGAEALLKTRQPYLTDAQRRAVLYTTSLDSGYPLLDSTNGWGRLNLVEASDGYGAFLGDVTVNMDAAKGRFNAHDWWRNDISGQGKLTKKGSGILTLTGNNSYSGGTVLAEGTLEAQSSQAFGIGDVYATGGTLAVDAEGALELSNLVMDAGTLSVGMDADVTQVEISGGAYLEGVDLKLDFSGYELSAPADFTLIHADNINGTFKNITADGYSVTLKYKKGNVIAHVEAN